MGRRKKKKKNARYTPPRHCDIRALISPEHWCPICEVLTIPDVLIVVEHDGPHVPGNEEGPPAKTDGPSDTRPNQPRRDQ